MTEPILFVAITFWSVHSAAFSRRIKKEVSSLTEKKWWTLINSNSRMITFKSSHAYDTILNKPCNTFDTIFIHANVLYFVSWASKSYLIRIYSRAVSFNILTLPILPIYYLDIITDILFPNMMCRARFFYLHLYKTETIRFQEFCLFFL